MTEKINIKEKNKAVWAHVGEAIMRGGLVCLPVDTVYGIACSPVEASAVERLFSVKHRSRDKPVALAFSDIEGVHRLLPGLDKSTLDAVDVLLPGPATVILPAAPDDVYRLSTSLGSPGSIGVRVIPQPFDKIYRRLPSPLVLTSANLSGRKAPRSLQDIPSEILDACEAVIDAGACPLGIPSTVIDLRPLASGEPARILREGALGKREVERLLA